jgi:hypothetical protein
VVLYAQMPRHPGGQIDRVVVTAAAHEPVGYAHHVVASVEQANHGH